MDTQRLVIEPHIPSIIIHSHLAFLKQWISDILIYIKLIYTEIFHFFLKMDNFPLPIAGRTWGEGRSKQGWPVWPCPVEGSWLSSDIPECIYHSSWPEPGESWCSPWPFSRRERRGNKESSHNYSEIIIIIADHVTYNQWHSSNAVMWLYFKCLIAQLSVQ